MQRMKVSFIILHGQPNIYSCESNKINRAPSLKNKPKLGLFLCKTQEKYFISQKYFQFRIKLRIFYIHYLQIIVSINLQINKKKIDLKFLEYKTIQKTEKKSIFDKATNDIVK